MRLINWFKKKINIIVLVLSSVEVDMLKHNGNSDNDGINKIQSRKQGTLSDALIKGEITQEVKELRWRMYKVIQASSNITTKITEYDENGNPIITVNKINPKQISKKLIVDDVDKYNVIMVVNNSEISNGIIDGTNMGGLVSVDNNDEVIDSDGDINKTIGEISSDEYLSNTKAIKPIKFTSEYRPKFEIGDYVKKMVVRLIDNDIRLLEFYISKYPDNIKSTLFLNKLKKAMNNPRSFNSLEINTINHITSNTMGANDYELYEYEVLSLDKIIEFDGHYVVKYKCKVIIDGENILEKFREIGLDERYENKVRK